MLINANQLADARVADHEGLNTSGQLPAVNLNQNISFRAQVNPYLTSVEEKQLLQIIATTVLFVCVR